MHEQPLNGILVVTVEHAVAAPFCTSRLADAGARVVKVERPEGDFARGYDRAAAGESSYFVWLNRGKESVVVDLSADADRRLLLAMTDRADVFVQNLKPGSLERKGLGFDALRARNPGLICCAISGYGETGPYAKRKAYDLLIQAESGLCSITGGPEEPARVGISVVDIATGAAAQAAILEALIARDRTGEGTEIQISMFDVAAEWLSVPFLHAAAGTPPRRMGLTHPSISPYSVFRTSDGRDILIAVQNDREWAVLCRILLERPEWATDPRFATAHERVVNRAEVNAAVAAAVEARDAAEVARLLLGADIAFAGVNDMDGLIAHPHLSTALVETPAGAAVALPAPAAIFDGGRRVAHAEVPALGQHSNAIRAEFGAVPYSTPAAMRTPSTTHQAKKIARQ
ncbi:CaiB/BaiF CoA transferase family protein [Rhodospira trueperi]|uniref:Crotonobetainyl-CoA:carnitine CoA-transferase CaiB n=1 Tax=Rhodospira trueperi TaxID=69960 RepID=A0A1G7GH04_9PROT|nr:CaiB/BaiF CoA-transferase family protein [Rhodospira trueperi]SDE87396.1 Crotonobetainyl-CoA:carnitine CoA-transferase CaiB [Rhodospira trueperi]